jgi:response regulator RpfG family c-di-GMP phosphodiesterase
MLAARILVVDNEGLVAKNLENRLKKAGYTTLGIALSGIEAINMTCELRPDLILMDIGLDEGFDGIETTARIHDFFDVPVIYLTGHDEEEYVRRANQTEPYGYLIKPIELNVLRSTIEVALHKSSIEKKLKQQLRRLTAVRAIDQAILSRDGVVSVLNIMIQQIVSSLDIDAACVMMLSSTGFECWASLGFQDLTQEQLLLRPGEPYAGMVALQGRQLYIPNLPQETTLPQPEWVKWEAFQMYMGVPLIAKSQTVGVLELFHRSDIDLDREWLDFVDALVGQIKIALDNFNLLEQLRRTNEELLQSYDATILGWSRALELRDLETQGHSQRVTEWTLKLAISMDYPEDELVYIRRGALLHDIGKMGIPDAILLKPGPLTPAEWDIMRLHPQYAYNMLAGIPFCEKVLEIPYCHHEKWDGSGYPRGLKGEEIPMAARIFALIDVWDALRSSRPYKTAWADQEALEYIIAQSGTHFEPRIVDAFLHVLAIA